MVSKQEKIRALNGIIENMKAKGQDSAAICCADCPGNEQTYDDGCLSYFCYMTAPEIKRFVNGQLTCKAGLRLGWDLAHIQYDIIIYKTEKENKIIRELINNDD